MKHCVAILIVLLATPHTSFAEESWYGTAGLGVMIVDGIKPSNLERRIMNTPQLTSTSRIENKSNYKSIAVGRCINDYICIEGGYLWDAFFSTSLTVDRINVSTITVSGLPVDIGSLPIDITLRREADVSAGYLAVLGNFPVNESARLFGKIGIYDYRVRTVVKIPISQSIVLAEESAFSGIAPMASVGINLAISSIFAVRLEGQKIGTIKAVSASLTYNFK